MCTNNLDYNDIIVTTDDVEKAILSLNCKKSFGEDGIFAERLKYYSERPYSLFSLCKISLFVF